MRRKPAALGCDAGDRTRGPALRTEPGLGERKRTWNTKTPIPEALGSFKGWSSRFGRLVSEARDRDERQGTDHETEWRRALNMERGILVIVLVDEGGPLLLTRASGSCTSQK